MDTQSAVPDPTQKVIWQRIWDKLTTPHPTIQNDEHRQRAHLLAALLVVFLPLFAIPEGIRAIQTKNLIVYYWVVVGLLAFAYALSRSRHFQAGIAITLTVLTLLPIAGIVSQGYAPQDLLSPLIWMAPTVLIGSLLLSVRGTAVMGFINIALGFSLTRLLPDVAVRHLVYPLGYVLTVFLLLVAATAVRQRYLTQIKSQSQQLARSEEQFRALVENSHSGIVQIDMNYILSYVNSMACQIFDSTRDDLIGRDFRTVLAEESLQFVTEHYRRRQAGETVPSRYTFYIVRQNGERRLLEISSSIYTNSDGRVQTIAQLLDITDRKRTEDALRDSEALYQSLVNSLPQNIFRKDVNGRFTFANDNYCQAQGKPLAEIIGKTDFDLHPAETAHKYRAADQRVMNTGQILEAIEIFELLDGQKYHVQIVKTPTFDADDRVTGIQGIFWDITAIKKAQEALQQAHDELESRVQDRTQELANANTRLKELDRLKDQFIEDMSHELRTPLSNLSLHLDLLEIGSPEKHDKYIAVLRQSTQRLTHLSQDILTVTQLSLNQDDIKTSLLDLNEIIASIAPQHRQMAEDNALTLIVDTSPLPFIHANREHIRQVIANLLINSLNYTSAGQIHIQTSVDEARQMVCLQVKDTGIGIEADDLPFVFDRFYRGRQVSQMTIPGSGLGLAVVKEIVKMYGGSVEVHSEPNAGAVFRVWLPIASK